MKAARISEYGHPDMVRVVDTDKPEVTKGTVLVEMRASSLNPWDTTVREGYVKDMLPLTLPLTLGGDFAGVVSEVGPGVNGVAVGDKVYGEGGIAGGDSGTLAEYVRVKPGHVALMPANLDFTAAAAAPLTGVSALQALQEHMALQPGQKILIHGGAGGIGTAAIQLAKHLGAYVTTTATGHGLAYVKKLGADEIIDYKTQRFEELLRDYDAVFDTVDGDTYERSFPILKRGGIIVSMLTAPNKKLMEQYGVRAIRQQTRITTEILNRLTKLIEDGTITIHVDQVFPLDRIVAAFTTREQGGIKGKVAIRIG